MTQLYAPSHTAHREYVRTVRFHIIPSTSISVTAAAAGLYPMPSHNNLLVFIEPNKHNVYTISFA